jgi:hypothetical protein
MVMPASDGVRTVQAGPDGPPEEVRAAPERVAGPEPERSGSFGSWSAASPAVDLRSVRHLGASAAGNQVSDSDAAPGGRRSQVTRNLGRAS